MKERHRSLPTDHYDRGRDEERPGNGRPLRQSSARTFETIHPWPRSIALATGRPLPGTEHSRRPGKRPEASPDTSPGYPFPPAPSPAKSAFFVSKLTKGSILQASGAGEEAPRRLGRARGAGRPRPELADVRRARHRIVGGCRRIERREDVVVFRDHLAPLQLERRRQHAVLNRELLGVDDEVLDSLEALGTPCCTSRPRSRAACGPWARRATTHHRPRCPASWLQVRSAPMSGTDEGHVVRPGPRRRRRTGGCTG